MTFRSHFQPKPAWGPAAAVPDTYKKARNLCKPSWSTRATTGFIRVTIQQPARAKTGSRQ